MCPLFEAERSSALVTTSGRTARGRIPNLATRNGHALAGPRARAQWVPLENICYGRIRRVERDHRLYSSAGRSDWRRQWRVAKPMWLSGRDYGAVMLCGGEELDEVVATEADGFRLASRAWVGDTTTNHNHNRQ